MMHDLTFVAVIESSYSSPFSVSFLSLLLSFLQSLFVRIGEMNVPLTLKMGIVMGVLDG